MKLTLRQLEIFEAVAHHSSISRAAKALFLTQPAVSMQVAQLEEVLGVALIEVIGRKVYITESGHTVLKHSQKVREQIVSLQEEIGMADGELRGTVHISIPSALEAMMFDFIAEFIKRYPEVRFDVLIGNRQGQMQTLLDNKVDLALLSSAPKNLPLVRDEFLELDLNIIAPASHELVGQKSLTIQDLAKSRLILGEKHTWFREEIESRFEPHVHEMKTLEVNDNQAISVAVKSGLGIAVLANVTVAEDLKNGELSILDVEGFPIRAQLQLVSLKHKQLAKPAQAFKAFMCEEAEDIVRRAS